MMPHLGAAGYLPPQNYMLHYAVWVLTKYLPPQNYMAHYIIWGTKDICPPLKLNVHAPLYKWGLQKNCLLRITLCQNIHVHVYSELMYMYVCTYVLCNQSYVCNYCDVIQLLCANAHNILIAQIYNIHVYIQYVYNYNYLSKCEYAY